MEIMPPPSHANRQYGGNHGSGAGAYPITLSGGVATNYNLTLQDGTLTITKAALTAKADDQSRVYGQTNPTLTISYTGL